MEVSIMKLSKNILFTLLFLLTSVSLTACQKDVSYINDQTGKEISVTTSDETYTFKLPDVESEESFTSTEETEPSIDTLASTSTTEEAETSNSVSENTIVSEGPKTGEP